MVDPDDAPESWEQAALRGATLISISHPPIAMVSRQQCVNEKENQQSETIYADSVTIQT